MELGIIRANVLDLPVSPLEREAMDEEIWEGQDGGAKFKMSRHRLEIMGGRDFIGMSVSGYPHERHRLVREFSEVLGDPFVYEPSNHQGDIETVGWLLDLDIAG